MIPHGLRMYVIVTQYLIFAAFLTFLGFYIGHKIDLANGMKDFFSFFLGLLGIIIGLGLFIYNILKVKHGKKTRN